MRAAGPVVVVLSALLATTTAASDRKSSRAGSVMVTIVGLKGPGLERAGAAVEVYIGTRLLYRTPGTRPSRGSLRFGRRIRAYTAHANPLVFAVVSSGTGGTTGAGASGPGPRPRHGHRGDAGENDDVLSWAFDSLVADVGEQAATADRAMATEKDRHRDDGRGEGVLCRTRLDWPPRDGEHALSCGSWVLKVRTRMLKVPRPRTDKSKTRIHMGSPGTGSVKPTPCKSPERQSNRDAGSVFE